MDVTDIMEKTVKNTGGVAALQKMPKNYENARQLVTDCHRFKVGDKLPPLTKKKEALSGFLEIRVLFAEDVGDPKSSYVM